MKGADANLSCRFREAAAAPETLRDEESVMNAVWWKSFDCQKRERAKIKSPDAYTVLPDSYLDISSCEMDFESPVPVSKVSIQSRQQSLIVDNQMGAEVKPGVQGKSEDILQEWRSNRKYDILNYTIHSDPPSNQSNPIPNKIDTHFSENNTVRTKKQEYYELLADKYLHQDRPSVCNPITTQANDISPYKKCLQTWTRDTPHTTTSEVNTADTHTRDTLEQLSRSTSSTGLVPFEEDSVKEKLPVVKIDAETNTYDSPVKPTRHATQQTPPIAKRLTHHAVQTCQSSETTVQTAPLPSPPTKDTGPLQTGPIQELEDSLWSVSSLTSESVAEVTDRQNETHSVPEGEDYLDTFKEDELVKLLTEKARFYEQHIENINHILHNFN